MTTRTELIERLHNVLGVKAEYVDLVHEAADMLEADGKYDQQAMELCEVCGWKAKMDGDPCLVCQLPKIDKLREAARLALDALKIAEKHLAYVEITEAIWALKEVLK